jgi:hypothetical protein
MDIDDGWVDLVEREWHTFGLFFEELIMIGDVLGG